MKPIIFALLLTACSVDESALFTSARGSVDSGADLEVDVTPAVDQLAAQELDLVQQDARPMPDLFAPVDYPAEAAPDLVHLVDLPPDAGSSLDLRSSPDTWTDPVGNEYSTFPRCSAEAVWATADGLCPHSWPGQANGATVLCYTSCQRGHSMAGDLQALAPPPPTGCAAWLDTGRLLGHPVQQGKPIICLPDSYFCSTICP